MKETLANAIYRLSAEMTKLLAETNVNPMYNMYDPKEKEYDRCETILDRI